MVFFSLGPFHLSHWPVIMQPVFLVLTFMSVQSGMHFLELFPSSHPSNNHELSGQKALYEGEHNAVFFFLFLAKDCFITQVSSA